MSSAQAHYFLLTQSLSHSKCSWRREYLKLSLGKRDRLESIVEYEDKTIYRPALPFNLPCNCRRITKLEYTQALLRFRKDAAERKRAADAEKAARKLAAQKLNGIRGMAGPASRPVAPTATVVTAPDTAPAAGLFDDFTIVDTEYQDKHLLEVAAIRYKNWQPVGQLVSYVRFRDWVAPRTTELTGITAELLHNAPHEKAVLQKFAQLAEGSLLIAHNSGADRSQLERARQRQGAEGELPNRWFCTMKLARARLPKSTPCGLGELCQRFGFSRHGAHQALRDVEMCFQVLRHFHQEEPILSLDPKARTAAPQLFPA